MSEAVTRPVLSAAGLLASLDPLLRGWLPRQRWFAGKGRPVAGFSPVAVTGLLPAGGPLDLYHLLVRVDQPSPSGGPAGPGDCYQLLVGVRDALPPRLAPALIGHVRGGPLAGRTVYDALYDRRPAEILLEALRTRARIGALRFEGPEDEGPEDGGPEDGADASRGPGRPQAPTVPGVQRGLRGPGSPEGFGYPGGPADVPADGPGAVIRPGLVPRLVTAEQSNSSVVYGDTFILKVLRRVVPGVNPDLELPLALAREGCDRVPAPTAWIRAQPADAPYVLGVLQPYVQGAEDGWELALDRLAKGEDFTAEARALGRATAEVHTALARALPTVTLGRAQLEPLIAGMRERLQAAAQAVPALRPHAPALHTAFDALAALAAQGRTWTAQRVHGDLHLGQCLRTPSGAWSLIDFEGEPARPLAERRMPQPAVRDVAGMLRSFDYAAHSAGSPAPGWAGACRDAFCTGYAEASGADPRCEPVLLRAYETDKAVYEVVYEARHRPDWLAVPLSAVRRLASPHPS